MPKLKLTDGCIVCGRNNTWAFGITGVDKDGKKAIVKICFCCLPRLNLMKRGEEIVNITKPDYNNDRTKLDGLSASTTFYDDIIDCQTCKEVNRDDSKTVLLPELSEI